MPWGFANKEGKGPENEGKGKAPLHVWEHVDDTLQGFGDGVIGEG